MQCQRIQLVNVSHYNVLVMNYKDRSTFADMVGLSNV